jgi:hypothetical protein
MQLSVRTLLTAVWNAYSNPLASDPSGPFENSGPYDSWRTTHESQLPADVECRMIASYYDRMLTARGWTPRATSGVGFSTYLRGASFLVLTCSPGARWSLGVDYSDPHYRS